MPNSVRDTQLEARAYRPTELPKIVFNFSKKITVEIAADQSALLKLAFTLIQNAAQRQIQSNPSFYDRMRATFDYGFAGGWVRKLHGTPQTITLKGESEIRKFIELTYMVALGFKRTAAQGSADARYDLVMLKAVIFMIATQSGMPLPPFEALDVP